MQGKSLLVLAAVALAVSAASAAIAPDFTPIESLLKSHVADRTFPGCTYVIANQNGVLRSGQVGSFVYDGDAPPPHSEGNPPMDADTTLFDIVRHSALCLCPTPLSD